LNAFALALTLHTTDFVSASCLGWQGSLFHQSHSREFFDTERPVHDQAAVDGYGVGGGAAACRGAAAVNRLVWRGSLALRGLLLIPALQIPGTVFTLRLPGRQVSCLWPAIENLDTVCDAIHLFPAATPSIVVQEVKQSVKL
jgi:hypothetical protein